jgi:hypothetical protein
MYVLSPKDDPVMSLKLAKNSKLFFTQLSYKTQLMMLSIEKVYI